MEENGQCGICYITGPLEKIQKHFMLMHVEALEGNNSKEDENVQNQNPSGLEESVNAEGCENRNTNFLHWTPEYVLLLIRLIERHYDEFNLGLKKNVYIKIAKGMEEITNKNFSYEQIESKWKGLKKTYKNVRDHNQKSGNSHKRWQYFDAMESFMAKKPEIEPTAVCSSTSATLTIRKTKEDEAVEHDLESDDGMTSPTSTPQSILGKKRKHSESAIQKRHEQKMARHDTFLKLFQLSVEHQIGKKVRED